MLSLVIPGRAVHGKVNLDTTLASVPGLHAPKMWNMMKQLKTEYL